MKELYCPLEIVEKNGCKEDKQRQNSARTRIDKQLTLETKGRSTNGNPHVGIDCVPPVFSQKYAEP